MFFNTQNSVILLTIMIFFIYLDLPFPTILIKEDKECGLKIKR